MKPLAAVAALLLPVLALAQDSAPQLQEDPRAAKFRDVERGFFIGFEAGYMGWLDTPTADQEQHPLAGASGGSAGGLVVAALVGVDLGKRLSLALYGQGGNAKANPDYGSFGLYAAGGDAKVALLGHRDRNDWERLYLYAHGRAGLAWSSPKGLFGSKSEGILGSNELTFAAGLGVEYYTRLRHFSIALGGDVTRATKAGATGFAVYPTLRYTF